LPDFLHHWAGRATEQSFLYPGLSDGKLTPNPLGPDGGGGTTVKKNRKVQGGRRFRIVGGPGMFARGPGGPLRVSRGASSGGGTGGMGEPLGDVSRGGGGLGLIAQNVGARIKTSLGGPGNQGVFPVPFFVTGPPFGEPAGGGSTQQGVAGGETHSKGYTGRGGGGGNRGGGAGGPPEKGRHGLGGVTMKVVRGRTITFRNQVTGTSTVVGCGRFRGAGRGAGGTGGPGPVGPSIRYPRGSPGTHRC